MTGAAMKKTAKSRNQAPRTTGPATTMDRFLPAGLWRAQWEWPAFPGAVSARPVIFTVFSAARP